MADALIPPRYEDPFVDREGRLPFRHRKWVDEVSRLATLNGETIDTINNRLDALEPQYVTKSSADSPYSAANMDYVTADMSSGDLTVVLPSTGRLWVTRDGSSNTLTLQGTVSGATNPTILFNNTTVALFHNGTEWRYA